MIFCYSGTGNSTFAAQYLQAEGEDLVNIGKAIWEEKTVYEPDENEPVGFVFPIYFGGMPNTVREFIAKIRFSPAPRYVYAVVTCGSGPAGIAELLKKALAANGTPLHAVYSVKMPANYALMYDVTSPEKEGPILEAADKTLASVKRSIGNRRKTGMEAPAAARLQTKAMYPLYDLARKTAPFHVNETCIGCGVCAGRCPARAIEMIDGVPTWVKDKCDHCMSCVRCGAIEYGSRLKGKYRYKHPSLRKKSGGHSHGGEGKCC